MDALVKRQKRKEKKEQENYEKVKNANPRPLLVEFIVGIALISAGFFMITQNTILLSGFSLIELIGITPPFGVILLPMLIGIAMLFYNNRSIIGWVLTCGGMSIIILGIIMGLRIKFMPITLFEGLIMFGMLFAGIGIVFRTVRYVNMDAEK